MTWLLAFKFLKKYGPALVVFISIFWVTMEFLDRGRDIVRLEEANKIYQDQISIYEDNTVKVELVRAQVLVCLDRIEEVQAIGNEWQARYEAAERKPPCIVRVPVEVAAPGMPCADAVIDVAEWLAMKVPQ